MATDKKTTNTEQIVYLAQVVFDTFEPANPTPMSQTTMIVVYATDESDVERLVTQKLELDSDRANLKVKVRLCTVFQTIKP